MVHGGLNPPVVPEDGAKDFAPINHDHNPNTHCDFHPSHLESDISGGHAGEWLLLTHDVQNLEVNLLDFSNDDIAGPIEEETLIVPSIQPAESRPCVDDSLPATSPLPVSSCPERVHSST